MVRAKATTQSEDFIKRQSLASAQMVVDGKIKPHSNHRCGWHESPKAGRIWYRSSYELKYYQILDETESVLGYEIEPFTIPYEFEGVVLNYVPDVLAFYEDRTELVEIKPAKLCGLAKNSAKIDAGAGWSEGKGLVFRVISEEDLS